MKDSFHAEATRLLKVEVMPNKRQHPVGPMRWQGLVVHVGKRCNGIFSRGWLYAIEILKEDNPGKNISGQPTWAAHEDLTPLEAADAEQPA